MLGRLTDYLIALVDYISAETTAAKRSLINLAVALGVVLVAGLALAAALGFFAWSLFSLLVWLNPLWSATGGAAAVLGVVMLIAAGVLLWLARRIAR